MESALGRRDRIGVQDFVLLENYRSEEAFMDNLRKRFRENLIYVSLCLYMLRVYSSNIYSSNARLMRAAFTSFQSLHPLHSLNLVSLTLFSVRHTLVLWLYQSIPTRHWKSMIQTPWNSIVGLTFMSSLHICMSPSILFPSQQQSF